MSKSGTDVCLRRYQPQQLVKGMYAEFMADWLAAFPRHVTAQHCVAICIILLCRAGLWLLFWSPDGQVSCSEHRYCQEHAVAAIYTTCGMVIARNAASLEAPVSHIYSTTFRYPLNQNEPNSTCTNRL